MRTVPSLCLGLLYFQVVLTLGLPQLTEHYVVAGNSETSLTAPTIQRKTLSSVPPPPTPAPHLEIRNASINHNELLNLRAITTEMMICGYVDGDPSRPRTANGGYNCRVDISLGLWGFCPTSVISASDCGLVGVCVDGFACSTGCGQLKTRTGITTFTW